MPMAQKYKSLRELLAYESIIDENAETARCIESLRHVKRQKFLTKPELRLVCRWKSPRAIQQVERNHGATVRSITRKAFSTKSERTRITYLTHLIGVGLPMASAILMLTSPNRYGVIDIRVWQALFAVNSVTKNPKGVGFNFKNWFQYLCILRYHAKELGVPVRAVERTLFAYHRKIQIGLLYD